MKTFLPVAVQTAFCFRTTATQASQEYDVTPFHIDLSEGVPRMMDLVRGSQLPQELEYPGVGSTAGIDLHVLKSLRDQWLTTFDWEKEQAALNEFKHFTAHIEGLTIHFIHEKSCIPDAIPLILNHGWPGSFLEFTSVISNLTEEAKTSTGKPVAFDVVVPSIPGFGLSSAPSANWTTHDTARKFATHGTDWGSSLSYILYDAHNTTTRAAHFSFLPLFALTPDQLAEQGIALHTPLERFEADRYLQWSVTGEGYFAEQSTKPNTVGLALLDSPIGQLSWIGEKLIDWSDPRAGTGPSLLDHNEILRSVSLYYLTRTFMSSVYIYYQNPHGFGSDYIKARTDAPMLFSAFKYNVAFWPRKLVERVGNLVYYRNHDFGGHFAGLDNPPALIEDLREIGTYWQD